jgi:DNA-binding NarL/FixJ family response regulator
LKILIVDDNAAIRRLIAAIVLPFAGEIHECADGADALAGYQMHRPDLVLMDICMKNVDGVAATRQIKAADPSARILIVTDYDDDALRRAAISAGACGYVLKESLLELRRWVETSA